MVSLDSNINKKRVMWKSLVYQTFKKCKPNILGGKKYTHHGLTGYYYSFGNRGDYQAVDDCTVTTYAIKPNKNIKNKKCYKKVPQE